jgi:hypothetical protein
MSSTQRQMRGRIRGEGGSSGWVGQPAAIYCRISTARDEDQTGVDRQERLCREVAERLGLVVGPECLWTIIGRRGSGIGTIRGGMRCWM